MEKFENLEMHYFQDRLRMGSWTYCVDIRYSYMQVSPAEPHPHLPHANLEILVVRVVAGAGQVAEGAGVELVFAVAEGRFS